MNVAAAAEMVLPLMSEKCKCVAAGRAATPPSTPLTPQAKQSATKRVERKCR